MELVKQAKRILLAFPKIDKDFLEILKDRFAANGFTDERMIASVNYVIDNFTGWNKFPNIADFIQFDKKIKFYNWEESIEIGQANLVVVDIKGKPKWVLREDFEKYDFLKKMG